MKILAELRQRFRTALAGLTDDPGELAELVRPAQDARFGDYQANCAMPLGKRLGTPPREVAARIVARLDVADFCEPPEIAGPGFINLRLKTSWLAEQVNRARLDPRLGVGRADVPRTYVVDYSSPNVAKPMHVGHIRSTVIGDAICRMLRFAGHRAVSDNHLGDWGTQFGMIIYGYKHFVDRRAYESEPVAELGRLYKLVNQLVEYQQGKQRLPDLERQVAACREEAESRAADPAGGDKASDKKHRKAVRRAEEKASEARQALAALRERLAAVEGDPRLAALADAHPHIAGAVLDETARLHAGDVENRRLWEEFLPKCREEIERVYRRVGVEFDFEYGESFYLDRLAAVVDDFLARGLAKPSLGAICVFLEGFDTPMIIRKKDGAFLYATTDLATIQFRVEQWDPHEIVYVVDHRQSEHFEKLFAAARLWGYDQVGLRHVSFGTVLGKDGKPYRTRSGGTVGLEGLLDEAVQRALAVVRENDDAKPGGGELNDDERAHVANVIGHAAIKYADLSHNRTSDYEFDEDKMVAMQGNTATYMQYSFARVNGIFARGRIERDRVRSAADPVRLDDPSERALALELLRFDDALADALEDYRPNLLTGYLYELTKVFFTFYEKCPVLKADSEAVRTSRLLLCDLTGRTIRQGLQLLGIDVVERM